MQFRQIGSTDNSDLYLQRKDSNSLLGVILLALLSYYGLTQTFTPAKLIYLIMVMYFAMVVKRMSGGRIWLTTFLTGGLTAYILAGLCFDHGDQSVLLGGLAGLVGAMDSLYRRASAINKAEAAEDPAEAFPGGIWQSSENRYVAGIASLALILICQAGDFSTFMTIIFGTAAGWLSGYVAPLQGTTRLFYNRGCRVQIVSSDFNITGIEQINTLRVDRFDIEHDVLVQETTVFKARAARSVEYKVIHGSAGKPASELVKGEDMDKITLHN